MTKKIPARDISKKTKTQIMSTARYLCLLIGFLMCFPYSASATAFDFTQVFGDAGTVTVSFDGSDTGSDGSINGYYASGSFGGDLTGVTLTFSGFFSDFSSYVDISSITVSQDHSDLYFNLTYSLTDGTGALGNGSFDIMSYTDGEGAQSSFTYSVGDYLFRIDYYAGMAAYSWDLQGYLAIVLYDSDNQEVSKMFYGTGNYLQTPGTGTSTVPEPATLFLLGTGLLCFAGLGRKTKE